MKTIAQPAVITPTIIGLALLFAIVTFIGFTGTPIENRLSELRGIFKYLNAGYLGPQAAFQSNFARPIERLQDAEASQRSATMPSSPGMKSDAMPIVA